MRPDTPTQNEMFNKVLIANRGEIACRVIRTLNRLGVQSVAIYSEVDRGSLHVRAASEAFCVGPAPAAQSYLNGDLILDIAQRTGAQGIHPGYGFLSENADFAAEVERRGLAFIGPTAEQMRRFGVKHTARALAQELGVPLLPGTELLNDATQAAEEAARIGYPVMLKSTAGGGGIGMQLCRDEAALRQSFDSVRALGAKNFKDGGVFLEKFVEQARHIEVQIFGDGQGNVITLGERDCSTQRRNQKVIEETPAPGLSDGTRQALYAAAVKLGRAVKYRSAGTVEFVYDQQAAQFYFLEVNTRLQVEHGVTELVTGIDLVEWMVRLAAGDASPLSSYRHQPQGHAVEVRVYAEDPARDFKPSAGLLTEVAFPAGARCDTWVESGSEVPPNYDPMIAKLLTHGADRAAALDNLQAVLAATRLGGIETNLGYLHAIAASPQFRAGGITTSFLKTLPYSSATFDVLVPGTQTTVQDYPGRLGFWDVGIPPSGPMDHLSFRLANRIVGNEEGTAALELTVSGPTLRFAADTVIALTGAPMKVTLDDQPMAFFEPISVRRGQVLRCGKVEGHGCRSYLAVRHGIDVPEYLGSRSTFTLGLFGGHAGRVLRTGDVLRICTSGNTDSEPRALPANLIPKLATRWEIGVLYGPHGAPDFFTERDIETFFAADFEVHYNSARTGVRLIGPKPHWARTDGGEAGLHPSNIHDCAYAVGTVDFTGDMPIILGPDGPSLGGFVCPATIVQAELWKMGQLRPGDKVRFMPMTLEQAAQLERAQDRSVQLLEIGPEVHPAAHKITSAVLQQIAESHDAPQVVYRPSGDKYLLVEYGPLVLDLRLRFRVHALMQWLIAQRLAGIIDLTPGIRSLQIHYDSKQLSQRQLIDRLSAAERELPAVDEMVVPTRTVHLPLSWDDPATQLAIEKYMQGVRKDAPWVPSNLEFIRRINGLQSIDAVREIVFNASYLVLGLGDVYLGAPVATPLDPRHRLVTTKYNPARTWTPENAVGIGGAYLCIYGMEGPGGYQFVGRTLQMFNRFRRTQHFTAQAPWLLRFFDQIRFYPVEANELLEMREAFPLGQLDLKISEEQFKLREYLAFLEREKQSIAAFKSKQQGAFEAERQRWVESGQINFNAQAPEAANNEPLAARFNDAHVVESHVPGSVWKVRAAAGSRVTRGDVLVVIESMKMEIAIEASASGTVLEVLVVEGSAVSAGQALVALREEG
ncbi:MAG TPA: urea carboxylase [Polyangiaceae bacterium]|nr:urea carboxylase [Polyangiaceae bacterium]